MEEQLRDGQAPDADITEEMIAACRGRAAFYDMLAAIYFRFPPSRSRTSPRPTGRSTPM